MKCKKLGCNKEASFVGYLCCPHVTERQLETCPVVVFTEALRKIEEIMRENYLTHKTGSWRPLGVEGNLDHLATHLTKLLTGPPLKLVVSDEDHLVNLACRALMALQLREMTSK